jgi:hypothetical protein
MPGHHDTHQLFKKLTPKKLVALAADLLSFRGHTEVKITDGPGDGGRDISSVTPEGRKHVTQVKFHKATSKTVSSKEIDEVAYSFNKFGYKDGLFVTTGRISPQAKRELLDNYPEFSISFLDGEELSKEVLSNAIMSALWFDGEVLDRVAYKILLPFFLRNLETDKYLPFPIEDEFSDTAILDSQLIIKERNIQIKVTRGTFRSPLMFEPYRPPQMKTISEDWGTRLKCYNLTLSGPIPFDSMDEVLIEACRFILGVVIERGRNFSNFIALRAAKPQVIPLHGRFAGSSIEVDTGPATLLYSGVQSYLEIDHILPSIETAFESPKWARSSGFAMTRWLHREKDILLNITLASTPSYIDHARIDEHIELFSRSWKSSIFCLLDEREVPALEGLDLPVRAEVFDWYEGKVLCAWFNASVYGGLVPSPTVSDVAYSMHKGYYEHEPFLPFKFFDDEWKSSCLPIREYLLTTNAQEVDPEIARYMMATKGLVDIREDRVVQYGASELINSFGTIPSPIDFSKRSVEFIKAWRLEAQSGEIKQSRIEHLLASTSAGTGQFNSKLDLFQDSLNRNEVFLTLTLVPVTQVPNERTDDIVKRALPLIAGLSSDFEDRLAAEGLRLVSSSKYLCEWEYDVHFDDSPYFKPAFQEKKDLASE